MTTRQSRMRERRRAEGGKQITCILLPFGVAALEEIKQQAPGLTLSQIISTALVNQAVALK